MLESRCSCDVIGDLGCVDVIKHVLLSGSVSNVFGQPFLGWFNGSTGSKAADILSFILAIRMHEEIWNHNLFLMYLTLFSSKGSMEEDNNRTMQEPRLYPSKAVFNLNLFLSEKRLFEGFELERLSPRFHFQLLKNINGIEQQWALQLKEFVASVSITLHTLYPCLFSPGIKVKTSAVIFVWQIIPTMAATNLEIWLVKRVCSLPCQESNF